MEKIFYRVEHKGPRSFLGSRDFTSLADADQYIIDIPLGTLEEYRDYWKQVQKEMCLFEVTETIEKLERFDIS